MSAFHNRSKEVKEVCLPADQMSLLNIYGEGGIGKTSLLEESIRRLHREKPLAITIFVDLADVAVAPQRDEALLSIIVKESEGRLSGVRKGPEETAGQIVGQLDSLAISQPVYVMFDNTEKLQEDTAFWEWTHKNLVEPLVIGGRVKQIFSGRIPVPWRRFELRRVVTLSQLGPIDPNKESRELIKEALENTKSNLKDQDDIEQAINLVLEFSFGHPGLSTKIAEYVAPRWPAESLDDFKIELCKDVVEPFINQFLFEDVEPLWNEILWWASALDWFDTTILQRYLEQLGLEETMGKPDYFFIQGLARLRTKNTVVWREEHGDRLHGVLRDIVRQCLKTMDPARYRKACSKVAETFQSIADEFVEEKDYAEQYSKQAELYQRRANNVKEKNNG